MTNLEEIVNKTVSEMTDALNSISRDVPDYVALKKAAVNKAICNNLDQLRTLVVSIDANVTDEMIIKSVTNVWINGFNR
jgi:hypothetical protein